MGMALRAVDPHDSRWLRVNQKFCGMLGYTREELLQLTSVEISVPDEQYLAVEYNEQLLRGDLSSYSREKRYLRKDGTAIWTQIWLSAVLDPDGNPAQIISVIEDISERKRTEEALKESEEKFRAVVDNTPAAILLKDTGGRYLIANKVWHDWFNPEEKDIAGKTVFDFYHKKHAKEVTAQDRQVLELGKPVESELRTPFGDGRERTTILQKFPIYDADGRITAIGGINTDITAAKQHERELADQTARLETVMEDILHGVTLIDSELRIVAYNQHFMELMRFPDTLFAPGDSFEKFIRYNAERGDYGPGDVDEQSYSRKLVMD